jgi:hypothetical protein
MRLIYVFCLFLLIPLAAFSQRGEPFRGSIPEALFRPSRGEAPHYPADIVIGDLGRGSASAGAFAFANSVAAGLLSGQAAHPSLDSINPISRDSYLSALRIITPESFRVGSGRIEADGAVSFLIRFIGRELGIIGEMYIRFVAENWVFEELLLEEPVNRNIEHQRAMNRFNFDSYERFF